MIKGSLLSKQLCNDEHCQGNMYAVSVKRILVLFNPFPFMHSLCGKCNTDKLYHYITVSVGDKAMDSKKSESARNEKGT